MALARRAGATGFVRGTADAARAVAVMPGSANVSNVCWRAGAVRSFAKGRPVKKAAEPAAADAAPSVDSVTPDPIVAKGDIFEPLKDEAGETRTLYETAPRSSVTFLDEKVPRSAPSCAVGRARPTPRRRARVQKTKQKWVRDPYTNSYLGRKFMTVLTGNHGQIISGGRVYRQALTRAKLELGIAPSELLYRVRRQPSGRLRAAWLRARHGCSRSAAQAVEDVRLPVEIRREKMAGSTVPRVHPVRTAAACACSCPLWPHHQRA
jgi:hypothetical protein